MPALLCLVSAGRLCQRLGRVARGSDSQRVLGAEAAARVLCSLQPMEIFVDDEAKLTLHGLVQHYIMLQVRV